MSSNTTYEIPPFHSEAFTDMLRMQKLDFVVLWGSQSGRSEIIARQFAKSLQVRFGLKTLAADMDDFDANSLSELKETQPCAFIVSTYGDGDPPDGAEGLWSFLKSTNGEKTLSSLCYVIFGLGNSNYRQYNQAAKTVDARLQELGANRLGNLGAGDDANGNTETDFLQWRKETQALLQSVLGLTEQAQSHQPSFIVKEDASVSEDQVHFGVPIMSSSYGASSTVAVVKEARKLWVTEERLCLHMDLDLGADRQLKYKTGDHVAIWPCNPDREVEALMKSLSCGEKRHVPITVEEVAGTKFGKLPCPSPTTLDALFRNYIEICGRLSMDLIGALTEFAPSENARTRLVQISDDPQVFKDAVATPHLTLGGLLRQTDAGAAWNIPISFLLERLKPMQPRYYSISSSAVVNPRIATITAVVDKPLNPLEGGQDASLSCSGLATGYLWAVERVLNNTTGAYNDFSSYALDGPRGALTGGKMYCNTRQTSFKMPTKASSPIIMIGAGTGVAPFRAFVQERMQRSDHEEVGRTLLFMGFRNSDVDYIYKDEWEKAQQVLSPEVFDYRVACSRDQQGRKKYVQDLIKEHAGEVMELLEATGCRICICGSAIMARDVVETLVMLRCKQTGCTKDAALEWVRKMRQFGTLLEDVWG